MDLSQAGLFTFYIFSLRLDTPFHSPPLVTLFVNQYDTADTAQARVSLPGVCLRTLLADRGALQSSTGCLTHGRGLGPATKLTAHPAASLGVSTLPVGASSRWTAQPSNVARGSRRGTTGALREGSQNEQQDLSLLCLAAVRAVKQHTAEARPLKWVATPTNPAESYSRGLLTDHSIYPSEG